MLNTKNFVPWTPCSGIDEIPHPSAVCEPINLASTSLPLLTYDLQQTFEKGLSTLQLETIQRIFQSFSVCHGFLLGDATGVGKGRTIAGVLCECKARDSNFRAMWVSANGRLKVDAEREISELCDLEELQDNLMFASYTSLLQKKRVVAAQEFFANTENKENKPNEDEPAEKYIILDECHNLRNNSVTSKVIEDFVSSIPDLNVLYSSATAASSIKHIQYLSKLELWGEKTPFPNYSALNAAVKSYGTPLMELLAIQMRAKGYYISRQLSFESVTMEHRVITLTQNEIDMYDKCTQLLRENQIFGGSYQQTFFQKLITGMKTKYAIEIARERLKMGDAVVISLINTGEAYAKRVTGKSKIKRGEYRVCEDFLDKYGCDVEDMPINPVDEIINAFGHENVAELTGRTTTFQKKNHSEYESYIKGKLVDEASKFQKGEKDIVILSRAGGVGISLHDTTTGKRRTHIILEMPWSAEDFMQQIGRTHRSNSLSSPYYILMSTNIPAEMRFASAIVQKLASMGALIRGDRSSCSMQLLSPPKWNVNTRRSLGLYLATSRLLNDMKNDNTVDFKMNDITRCAALAFCGYPASSKVDVADFVLKTRLTKLLTDLYHTDDNTDMMTEDISENTTEDQVQYKINLLNASKCLFPQDTCPLYSKWSVFTHYLYPCAFKKSIFTLLLCYNSWETRLTLGILPEHVLHIIFEMLSEPGTLEMSSNAAQRFGEHGMKLDSMTKYQTDDILNKMLGMEISVQNIIISYTTFLAFPQKSSEVSCFIRFIKDRCGSSITSKICDIKLASFSEGAHGVQVVVSYEPNIIENPSEDSSIWIHERTLKVVWIKNNELISSDGSTFHIDDPSYNCMYSKGYKPTTYMIWINSVNRNKILINRKCRKLAKSFYIATDNVMQCWDSSLHKVLRIPSCIQFPKGLVGLLVFIGS